MTNVRDVLYLLSEGGVPLRSMKKRYDLSVEHIDDSSSVLSVTVPINELVTSQQQFLFRGQRYIAENISTSRDVQTQDVTAEIAYLKLAKDNCTVDVKASTVTAILTAILKGTKWKVGTVATSTTNHSMKAEDEPILGKLRDLANLTDLKLIFDTVNYTVSYAASTEGSVGFLAKYGKNIAELTRHENAPLATVVYPVGKDDLNIKSVNGGVSYVEDYSYYIAKGYTLAQARVEFKLIGKFEDDSFIYAGDLMRAAQKYLRVAARPQVSYDASLSALPEGVTIGQHGYVEDDINGADIPVKIARLVEYDDKSRNTVELGYFVPGLGENLSAKSGGGSRGMQTVMSKNNGAFIGSTSYQQLIDVDFSNTSPLNAQVFVNLRGILSADAILEAVIDLDGKPVTDYKITQVMFAGPQTQDYNFIITQIQEGSHTLRILLRTSVGSFTANPKQITISVQAENLVGGTGSGIPEINIVDDVTLPNVISVTEFCTITLEAAP